MTAGRKSITEDKDWGTPCHYVDAVKNVFHGKIDLDPCSNKSSIVNAKTEFLPENDGLKQDWNFPTIFVNPPYGNDKKNGTKIRDWLKKCYEAHTKYGSEVIALVPVAVNTGHWKNYVFGKAEGVCFLADTRLKFLIKGKDEGKGAPMACAMVYWGKNYERFFDVLIKFGAVVNISPLKT